LSGERFDLVYFSTTIFSAMCLGPIWRQEFGVPYLIDLQDPWVSDYYARTGTHPPGGRLRYAFSQWRARRLEPRVVRGAGHVICVSPGYVEALRARYPDLAADRFTVLPFAAAESDFNRVDELGIAHRVFDETDGLLHWVYLGRGGSDLAPALRGFFSALAELRVSEPAAKRLRMHFVGTSYAPQGRAVQSVVPVAAEYGLGACVSEQTDRLPYLRGISLLRSASALLIFGSDDPSYSASKVYPYVLARRPLVAILHARSPAAEIMKQCRAGEIVPFSTGDTTQAMANRLKPVLARLLQGSPEPPPTDWARVATYSAARMTRKQCQVFDLVTSQFVSTKGESV
jgi:hypothetical protein